jgi:hypothetical protein
MDPRTRSRSEHGRVVAALQRDAARRPGTAKEALSALRLGQDPLLWRIEQLLGAAADASPDELIALLADHVWVDRAERIHWEPRSGGARLLSLVQAARSGMLPIAFRRHVELRRRDAAAFGDELYTAYVRLREAALLSGGWQDVHAREAWSLAQLYGAGPCPTPQAAAWIEQSRWLQRCRLLIPGRGEYHWATALERASDVSGPRPGALFVVEQSGAASDIGRMGRLLDRHRDRGGVQVVVVAQVTILDALPLERWLRRRTFPLCARPDRDPDVLLIAASGIAGLGRGVHP